MKKILITWILILIIILFIIIGTINIYVFSYYKKGVNSFSDVNNITSRDIGLVFGASVFKDGTPSTILRDRLDGAIFLYKGDKIKKIIVSGYVSTDGYNEPLGMKKYLVKGGVNDEDILLDNEGIDTYHSVIHAYTSFPKLQFIFFSQDFQIQRAMYIAEKLGIDAVGYETNLRTYYKINYLREIGARLKAFYEVDILHTLSGEIYEMEANK